MPALARLQPSDCTNPELDIFLEVNGLKTDPYSLEFQIFELESSPGVPTQVYPLSGRQTVDIGTLCSGGGDKLSTGHFVAQWTPPVDEEIGVHHLKWFFKLQATSPEQEYTEEFQVLTEISGFSSAGYCTVQDMRDEGVTDTQASDVRLGVLIDRWTKMINQWTGRFFSPLTKTIYVDGRGGRILHLYEPIIDIDSVALISDRTTPSESPYEDDLYKIYNRHMTSGLLNPDDRDNPRLEMLHPEELSLGMISPGEWPKGSQNLKVVGTFGYTDPDGSAFGRTPELIKFACVMLVVKGLTKVGSIDANWAAQNRYRIETERTRDQEIRYGPVLGRGVLNPRYTGFSGDSEIDNILIQFCRPFEARGV